MINLEHNNTKKNEKTSLLNDELLLNLEVLSDTDNRGKERDWKGKKQRSTLMAKHYEMVEDLKEYAINTFKAINARGVARIDFLIDDKTKKIYVSEINTIPGSLSLYLWLPKKKSQNELINDLINIAIEEYKNKQNLILSFNNNLLDKFDILDGKKLKK